MKIKEILIICIIIICCIFSFQAVSAADDGSTTDDMVLTSTDVSAYSLPNLDNQLQSGSGNAGSFSDLQNDTKNGGSITLNKNYTYNSSSDSALAGGISITKDTTIDGQGIVTIDANNMARVFTIAKGTTVTLKGITFINANPASGHGGSIFAPGVVHIDNCIFINNTANYANGGAVCLAGLGSTITNSYFEGNKAINNGNDNNGAAGAVFINANNTSISNSIFIKNMAGLNGGAIGSSAMMVENSTIINCTIANNTANGSAGGIGMQSKNFHIYNSTFKYNEAKGLFDDITAKPYYPGNGGAMVMRGWDSYAYNCTFIGNIAKQHGGATFSTNTSYNPSNNNTGFELCTFIDNTAGYNGGAVDWSAGATYGYIVDSTFINNTAKRSGGAIHWSGHYGTVSNSTFINNNATGEVISVIGGILGGGDGGAIVWVGSHGIINDSCNFTNNYAKNRGGAIYIHGNATENSTNVTMHDSIFIGNYAGINGGAVDWHDGSHDGAIYYSIFENNIAGSNGGAVFWSGHHGDIWNSNFTNNMAKGLLMDEHGNIGDGGAVIWSGMNGTVENCRFIDNTANQRGGAVYLQNCTHGTCDNTTFSNSIFINNAAGLNGGAIDWHEGASHGLVSYCNFENNIANRSAGAIFWSGHNGTVEYSNFTSNKALGIAIGPMPNGTLTYGGDGGAIMWTGAIGDVKNSLFFDNIAVKRGGGVFLQGTEIEDCYNTTFENSYFEGNVAGDEGGAINWDIGSQNGYVYNVVFVNNTAYTNGGAIHWNGYNGTIKSSTFRNNRATGDVRLYNMSLTLDDIEVYDDELPEPSLWTENKLYVLVTNDGGKISKFGLYVTTNDGHHHNWALLEETPEVEASPVDWAVDEFFGGDGGSIIWHGDVAHIDNCTFIDSNSARRGGAVYMTGGDYVEFTNCSFENCTSGTNGGALDWFAGANYGKVIDCNFTNTHAARSAGAIYYDGDNGEMRNIIIKNATAYGGARNESEDGKVKYACWDLSHWDTNTTGGDGGAMMFTGDHITVYNVNFTDCTAAGRGGAIFVQDNHNVTIDSCTFENNHALGIANNTYNDPHDPSSGINHNLTGHGGAIAFDTGATESSIINSIFNNNTAKLYGGAVHFREGASEDKVINSAFNNNYASEDGGALFIDGDNCELHDSTFNHNYVGDDGGAIYWHGQGGIINNINCTNNTGISSHGNSKGGTICLTGNDISLLNSRFEDSYAKVTGGAMFVTGNNVNITGTSFKNCNVSNSTGGALQLLGNNTQVRDCTFEDCHAEAGSAIYTEGNYVKVINSKFTNNNVTGDGGAVYVFGDYSELHNSTFISNSAGDDGGAIYWEGSHGIIYNITCENNNGISFNDSNSKGGTICLTGEDISISSSSFKTSSAGDDGGAIFISGNNVDIIGSDFEACNSSSEGGAIYVLGDDATISDCTFENCNATQGGAIYIEGKNAMVEGSNFVDSSSVLNGGAIYVSGDNAVIENSLINDTDAVYGGGIYIAGNDVKVDSTEFINLYSVEDGGAIYITGQRGRLYNSKFINNTAGDDGGAINWDGNYGIIDNIVCENNRGISFNGSSSNGGTISLTGNDTSISKSSFSQSYALISGGAIFVTGNNVNITDSEFENCYVSMDIAETNKTYANGGGAIYLFGDSSNVVNCNFDNSTGREGGAIYVQGNEVTIDKSSFTDSFALNGGAIYINGTRTVISNSAIDDSNATYSGGAVFIKGIEADIINSSFSNTNAFGSEGNGGGAIYIEGENVDVIGSNFTNTYANSNSHAKGGAMYITGANAGIVDSKFTNAHSNLQGGAIYVNGIDTIINGSEFYNCNVDSPGSEGGAIYIEGKNAMVEDSNFVDSSSVLNGGAIYIDGFNATVKDSNFTGSFVTGNQGTPSGGAIYIYAANATIEGSIFKHSGVSNSKGNGGTIFIHGDNATICGSEFDSSSANTGGTLYIEGDYTYVIASSVNGSYAYSNGGALYSTGSNSKVVNSNFTYNLAEESGGALYWYGGSHSKYNTVDGCIFTNNTAQGNVSDDAATRGGGAIYWSENGEYGTVKNSKFYYNSVQSTIKWKVDGGAILWDKSYHALVDNCIFVGNFVTTEGDSGSSAKASWAQGGAMYLRPYDNYTVWNCLFENCSSSKEAGALYIQSNNPTDGHPVTDRKILLENCVFINNVAQAKGNPDNKLVNGGGAIQIKQCGKALFNNLTFINNTANKGGALCVFDQVSGLVVDGANFTGNKANKGSAISTSVYFKLNNAVLIENRADTTKFDLTFNRENGGSIDILLEGADTHLNALYIKHGSKGFTISTNNVTYWTDNNISTGKTAVKTGTISSIAEGSVPEAGIATLVEIFDGDNNKLHEGIYATDANGRIHLDIADIITEPYSTDNIYVNARLLNEDYYTMVKKTSRIQNVYIDATALDTIFHRNTTVNASIRAPGNGTGQAARGIVSVYIDDVFKGNMTIENSKGSLENILTNVTADRFFEVGNHTVFLKYWGDAYFDEVNKTISFNITKAQSNITLDYYDRGYDFHVTVTIVDEFNDVNYRDANGTVIIDVYDVGSTTVIKSIPVNIVNSTGFVKITELLPANYTLVSHYSGDKNYNASINSTFAELHKKADAIINITVNAYDIMVNETVYINITFIVPPNYEATGNVTLYLDNEKYVLLLNNSRAYFNKTGLPAGVKIVTVCYDGSDLLIPTSSDATFRVYKYNTTLSVNTTNITHIQHEVINITLLNDTVGVVSVFINDEEYFARIDNGTAILELPLLPVGEYNVTVVFPGDDKYNNNTVKSKFKVSQVTPDVNIEVENVTYGDSTKIVVTIIDCVEGNVTIKIDGTQYGNPKPVENGRVEFVVEYLTAGNYTIEALYSGDINHTASSAEKDFAVYKANRTIVIEVQNITYGEIEHIKVYVNATGNVTIFVDGRNVTIELNESDVPATILRAIINAISEYKGKAALDVYNLNVGKYSVDVVYNGNENYNKATARATFIVSPVNTNLVIDTHRIPVWNTEYINVTVRNSTGGIAVNATGKIKLYIDGVEQTADIVGGVARFNIVPSSVGQKVVWAFYDGDINFVGNRSMKTFDVTQRNPHMNISAQNITVGQNGNITVQLPENATGYVEIEVVGDNKYYSEVIHGHVAVYPKNLKEGEYQVYVIYHGDQHDNYASVIKETYFVVSKAKVNVTIDVNDTVYDNAVNIVVYVDDGVEGNISIKLDTIDLGTYGIVDGKVNITIDNPGAGSYTVYAEYNGNNKYNVNKTESKGFTVDKATPVIIIDKVTVDANTNATIVVRINETASGKINITVNGKKYNATIENGVATFTIDKLLAGKYNITAEYIGDNNYTSVTGKTLVDGLIVTKVDCYQINVTADDTKVGLNTTIVVKVPADAEGNVSIYINGSFAGNATVNNGIAMLNVTRPYGNYTVKATFTDGKYGERYAIADFWVFKYDSPIVIDVDSILVGDKAYINVTAPSDNVTIEINGKSYNKVKYENGVAYFEVAGLEAGNKTVVAVYGGSDKYVQNATTANFTVDKCETDLKVTVISPINVRENATVTVILPDDAKGYVVVNVDGKNYTINLTAGQRSVEISGLKNSTYNVNATYLGDDKYLSSINNTQVIKVNKVPSSINLTVSENGIIAQGNDVNITIDVPIDATGKVIVKLLNGTELIKSYTVYVNEGKGLLHLDSPVIGLYNVTAEYLGDDKYVESENKTSFEVFATGGELNVDADNVFVNVNNTITVTISGKHEGEVTIIVSNASGVVIRQNVTITQDDSLSHAELTLRLLDAGKYDVKAIFIEVNGTITKVYEGNDTFEVYKLASNIQIEELNATIFVGENETIKLAIDLDPRANGGNISVFVNGAEYNTTTSKLILEIPDLNADDYNVKVIYHGNNWYNESSTTASFKVVKNLSPMTVNVTNSSVGSVEQINVTLPDNATGQVLLDINGQHYYANITEGLAQFNITGLKVGEYKFNVTYIGDYKYLDNNTNSVLKVSKLQPAFAVNGTNITFGSDELIKFETSDNITGLVKVEINNKNYTAFIREGKGNLTVYNLVPGDYNITLYFEGNEKYLNASAKNNFTVLKATPEIELSVINITYTENETVVVYVDAVGNVTLRIAEIGYVNTTDLVNGKAVFVVKDLAAGDYTANATFNGNVNLTSVSTEADFNVAKAAADVNVIVENITYCTPETIVVNVNTNGNVTIKVNGTVKGEELVIDNGKVELIVNDLAAGVYDVEVIYNGNENYTSATVNGVFVVRQASVTVDVEVSDINVTGKEIINVTISNVNATGDVIINVDGVNYTRPIAEGKANLTLDKLTNGTHSVVVVYMGDRNLTGNWTSATFEVNKFDSELTINVTDIIVSQKEIIKVNVTEGATGDVIITVAGKDYIVEIKNGFATLELDNLANGTYAVHVKYLGDANYSECEGDASFNVSKVQSNINLTVSHYGIVANGSDVNITIEAPIDATGKVNVTVFDGVQNKTYIVYVNDGSGILHLETPAVGIYNVTAKYLGDDKYIGSENKTEFEVYNTGKELTVDTESIDFGSDETILIYVAGNHLGKEVEVIVKDSNGNIITIENSTFDKYISIINGTSARLTLKDLNAGEYTVDAFYLEVNGTKVIEHSGSSIFEVRKLPSELTIKEIRNITVGENVTIELVLSPDAATGNISVFVNGIEHKTNTSNLTITIPNLGAEEYYVHAIYYGDKNHIGSNASAEFKVSKNPILIVIDVTNSKVGEVEQINVTLLENATGRVLLDIGDNHYYADVINGTVTFNIYKLDAGKYNFTVTYEGDDKYFSNQSNSSFIVSKHQPEFAVNVTDIIFGRDELIKFETDSNITAAVKVEINGENYTAFINEGKGNLTVYDLAAGDYNITLYFEGNEKYLNASAKNNFTVLKATPEIELSVVNITYTENETVTVYVDAVGNVTLRIGSYINTTDLIGGKAVFVVKDLAAGDYTANATYNGNDNLTGISTEAEFTVAKDAPEVTVNVENITYYSPETIVVNVNTNGNVTIKVNGTVKGEELIIDNGKVELIVNDLAAGVYDVEVIYNGNNNYTSATVNAVFVVKQAPVTVDVEVSDINVAGKEIINVTISNVNATGDVIINVDGVNYTRPIADGKANLTLDKLSNGTHSVVVIYMGDRNLTGNWSSKTFNVDRLSSELTINVTNINVNQKEIIKVNVTEGATGTVVITVDGIAHYVEIESGFATLELSDLANKTYIVHAEYLGDANYTGCEGDASFNVSKVPSNITVKVENITLGDVAVVNITVIVNATGNVTITIGDEYKQTVGLIDGVISVIVPDLSVGNKTVNVTYNGDGRFLTSTNSTNFTVGKATKDIILIVENITYTENETVTVYVDAVGNVTLRIDEIGYVNTTDLVDGKATFIINGLNAGNYTVEATFNGNNELNSTSASANFTVFKADPIITLEVHNIIYGDVEHIIVHVNAEGNVTIRVNGTTETIVLRTDDSGYVILRAGPQDDISSYDGKAHEYIYNLKPGQYPVEVTYNGNENYNTASTSDVFYVSKANSTIKVDVEDIDVGDVALINVTLPANATGNVTIEINGKEYKPESFIDGVAKFKVENLTHGNKTVAVMYSGDDNYTANSTTAQFTVSKVTPQITINVTDINVGDKVLIEVTAPGDVTNPVLVDVGGVGYYVNITGGKGELYVSNLARGDYNATARYLGDEKYLSAKNATGFKVSKVPSSVNVSVENITFGENAVINVETPDDLLGNVTVRVDGKNYTVPVSGGKGTLVVPGLAVGPHSVDVIFNGSDKYEPNSNSTKFNVAKAELSTDDIKVIDKGNGTVVVVVPNNATGNVTVKVGDKEFNATVVNGTAVVNLDNVTPGEHEIEVIYSGDDNYDNATVNSTVVVPKLESSVNVTCDVVGDKAVITVTAPDDATGNVTIEVDGEKYTVPIEDGIATLEIGNLTAGTKTIAVDYPGDDNYGSTHTTANVTVSKLPSFVNATISDIKAGENVTIEVSVPENATGQVLIDIDGVGYYVNVTDGKGVVEIPNISSGKHNVTLTYAGDDKYEFASNTTSFEVSKLPSDINVSVENINFGENAVINVETPDDLLGNVTVRVDGKDYIVPVSGGKGTLVVPGLSVGPHSVEVVFDGSDKYESDSDSASFNVAKAELSPDDVKVIDKGNGTVVVVVPNNATGNVTVKVGDKEFNATVVNGTAVVNLDNVTPGEHEIEVIYSGDDNYDNATVNATVTIPKVQTPISINVDDIQVGDDAVVKVNLPTDATGSVTIEIDGKSYTAPVVNGVATFEVPDLIAGDKTVVASYSGDDKYPSNYTTDTFTVSKRPATIDVVIFDIDVGENVTVIVTLPSDATGQVLIDIDGVGYYVNLTDGVGVASIPRIPSGVYNVNVTYVGDAKYLPNSTKGDVNVTKLNSFVIPYAEDIMVGDDEILTFVVPSDATGKLIVDDLLFISVDTGNEYIIDINDGTSELTVSGLPEGRYIVTVRYDGDEKYLPSDNSTTFKVSKRIADLDVVDYGNRTVVVSVPENATGTITIIIENQTYVANITDGKAVFYLENATPGVHDIEVIYSGDGAYEPSTVDSTAEIPKYNTPVSVSSEDISFGDTETITISLPEDAKGTVTIEIDGKTYTANVTDGKAVFNIPGLTVGNKTATIRYSGDDNYEATETAVNFTVNKCEAPIHAESEDIKVGDDETITVNFPKDATGRAILGLAGEEYYADIIDGKAVFTIPKLGSGEYEATVTYEGDDKYLPNSTVVSFTVSKNDAPASATGDNINIGDDGTVVVTLPSDATGTVTIVVDGKSYTAPVVNGKAVFKIPGLTVGVHIVDVYYSGDDKYAANHTSTQIIVDDNSYNPGEENESGISVYEETSLAKYPTGNPILILLLMLMMVIGVIPLRKFKKE